MKKNIYTLLAATALGFSAGCTDELNIPQKGVYPTDTYYSTDEEASTALALSMSYVNNMAFEIIESINCLSDDMWPGGANSGDQPGLHQFSGFYISTENDKVKNIYSFSYRLIYFSNVLIEKLEGKEDATPYMKQCVAEAYFLRGWAEFYLGALWGNPPIVDHVLSSSEYGVTNSEDGAMLEQAAKDLRHALDSGYLPKKNSLGDRTNLAHCTEAAALGYLGKVYLFQKKYAEAAETLDKIKLECQVELCMEGQRFMDLVRWGDAATELGTQGQNIEMLDIDANGKWILVPDAASSPTYGFKAGRNERLPYPQEELDQNPNIKQNPGY